MNFPIICYIILKQNFEKKDFRGTAECPFRDNEAFSAHVSLRALPVTLFNRINMNLLQNLNKISRPTLAFRNRDLAHILLLNRM